MIYTIYITVQPFHPWQHTINMYIHLSVRALHKTVHTLCKSYYVSHCALEHWLLFGASLSPLSHGPLNSDSQSGSNPGSTQMCVHTVIVWHQYVGNPVVEKMAFNEALLLFIFFWLRWRRLRLARARRWRITAAQSIELAVVVAQWCLTSRVAISAALCLLQGNRLKRRAWAKPRSVSLYQDIVPGWNDANFKANFHVRRATFAYLVNELQPVLQRQELLHSTIQLNSYIRPHIQKGHHFFIGPCQSARHHF